LKAVLDTHVWLDWLAFRDPSVALIREAVSSKLVEVVIDADCDAELERVLGYPKFKLDAATQAAYLAECRIISSPVKKGPAGNLLRCSDPDDQKFLELACQADVLITKDQALLKLARRKLPFRIVTPDAFAFFLLEKLLVPASLVKGVMKYDFGTFFVFQNLSVQAAIERAATAFGGADRRQPVHAMVLVPDLLAVPEGFGQERLWRFVREARGYLYILDPAELCRLLRQAVALSRLEKAVVPPPMVAFDFCLLERFNVALEADTPAFSMKA
jgi:putative PIN family toxin of toxin-antitoxin system